MCGCIDVLNKAIRERTGDPLASVQVGVVNVKVTEDKTVMMIQPTGIVSRNRTLHDDGTFTRNQTRDPIALYYCPFCGRKYLEDAGYEGAVEVEAEEVD